MFWSPDIDPAQERFKVLLKRGEFTDNNRGGRLVPYKIYHPDEHGLSSMPIIFWSHGFGGNRDGASFISRFLASYGYAVIHLTHPGTDSSLWEGKPGHPWDILRKTKVSRENSLDRFKDVPFALDQLKLWAKENPDIGQYMAFDKLGISGHSFGAMTAQVIAGMRFPDNEDNLMDMSDPRFKAGILYSPVPIAHLTDNAPEHIYGPINIPLLHMTGTQDDSPIENFGYEHRLVVHKYSSHPTKHLHVLKGGDHMIYNGTRGKLDKNPNRKKHEEIIKLTALAYWDAFLKDDKKAREWLTSEHAVDYMSEHAHIK